MQRLLLAAAVVAATALVWLASPELPAPARFWTALLLAVLPALLAGQATALGDPTAHSRESLYASTVLSLWLLAGATVAVTAASDWGTAELLLAPVPAGSFALWTGGLIAAALLVFVGGRLLGLREAPLTAYLLPVTGTQRAWFAGVSLTAGVTEELIFRGFLLTSLTVASGSAGLAVALSSVVFGVLHGYQGMAGAARPALLGVCFGVSAVATGSILPAMVAHVAVDLISGFWLGPRLLR